MKLRSGTTAFQMEMERWHGARHGVKRGERVCKKCDSGEIKDMCHLLCATMLCMESPQTASSGAMDGAGAEVSRSATVCHFPV